MDSFADKAPGSPWAPESAERYNAVNDLLRRFGAAGAGGAAPGFSVRGAALITAAYTGGVSLPAYSLLAVSGAVVENNLDPTATIFTADAADTESPVYGVAQSPVEPGAAVPVALTGITPVCIDAGLTLSGGETLAPLSGGVAALGSGGRMVALGSAVAGLAPVMLGGGGGAASPAKLAAVVTMPTSGGGMGTATPVMLGSGGEITAVSGGAISVKFPYLDGYN